MDADDEMSSSKTLVVPDNTAGPLSLPILYLPPLPCGGFIPDSKSPPAPLSWRQLCHASHARRVCAGLGGCTARVGDH